MPGTEANQANLNRLARSRDVKPDKSFCSKDENPDFVKLVDFGIAKSVGAAENLLSKRRSRPATRRRPWTERGFSAHLAG